MGQPPSPMREPTNRTNDGRQDDKHNDMTTPFKRRRPHCEACVLVCVYPMYIIVIRIQVMFGCGDVV